MKLVLGTTAAAAAATIGAAFLVRWIKRQHSLAIRSHLQCKCGRIQGSVVAKQQDSIRIHCYCGDCRQYCKFIASLGDTERRSNKTGGHKQQTVDEDASSHYYCGHDYSRVVQVCKSDLSIEKGMDLIKLARKLPPSNPNPKKQIYMHRFYASCCHVPLFNTVDFLGFVGIFTDVLDDNATKYAGPVRMFQEEALDGTECVEEDDICVPDFLWKLVRYFPWRNCGPFDYQQPPVYWGSTDS